MAPSHEGAFLLSDKTYDILDKTYIWGCRPIGKENCAIHNQNKPCRNNDCTKNGDNHTRSVINMRITITILANNKKCDNHENQSNDDARNTIVDMLLYNGGLHLPD